MQQQKTTFNFEQQIIQQIQTHQIQISKLCKRYSQQLQVQCRYKDSLIQCQRQKYKLQIQQQKQRYQRKLQYQIENNKMMLECQRDNYTNLVDQERKKFQFEKQQIYRQNNKQREHQRTQMKRQSQYIQEQCVKYVMENLRIQFKYQIQNIYQSFANQSGKQGSGQKIMKYFQKGLENMKQQLSKNLTQKKKKYNSSTTHQSSIQKSVEFDQLTLKCINLQTDIKQKNERVVELEKKIYELQKKMGQDNKSQLQVNQSKVQNFQVENNNSLLKKTQQQTIADKLQDNQTCNSIQTISVTKEQGENTATQKTKTKNYKKHKKHKKKNKQTQYIFD